MNEHPLTRQLLSDPYRGYTYAYPHKTAYRSFDPPISLQEAWSTEDKSSLFLYLHVPFCEMRCGFCNLFTVANPKSDLQSPFLSALERQMIATREALGDFSFSRMAIGGGTPTWLSLAELQELFRLLEKHLGLDPKATPVAIEVSPGTVDRGKLQFLKATGIERVSMGVQSFHPEITRAMGRPVKGDEVEQALSLLQEIRFPRLNLDLIYGAAGQSAEKWAGSLARAVAEQPEEIYLYPLYVRPLTGLEKLNRSWDDHRLGLYRQGRDYLLTNGYEQVSMRMFRRRDHKLAEGPIYCCQEDGMVGLGPGARSYTRELHYSSEYAVGRSGLKGIIAGFNGAGPEEFGRVRHGVRLELSEQKRRYLLKSLLNLSGMSAHAYASWFGSDPRQDFPMLAQLTEAGLASWQQDVLRLSADGLMLSDAIGPWLYSPEVVAQMEDYQWA